MCREPSYGRVPDTTRVREAAPGLFCWKPSVSRAGAQNDQQEVFFMKARATLLAIPLIVGVAFAQSTSGSAGQTQGSSGQSQSGSQSGSQPDRTKQSGSQADRTGQSGSQGSTSATPAAGML